MPGGKYRLPKEPEPERKYEPVVYFRSCKDIVSEAMRKDLWIYDPELREWYSPDEFEHKFGRILSGNQKFLDKVEVRDPFEGLKAGYQRIHELQEKLEAFTIRIVKFYKERKAK